MAGKNSGRSGRGTHDTNVHTCVPMLIRIELIINIPHTSYEGLLLAITCIIMKICLTPKCDKDGGGVDHTHITIEGGQVESLSSEVNRGDGERGTVDDGDS